MSSSIKDEYTKAESKPAAASLTIRSVVLGFGAMFLEHFVGISPVIAMLVWSVLPEWLQGMVTLDVLQNGVEAIVYGIAGYAGIQIVKERVKKGDIQGIVKPKIVKED